MRKRFVLSLVFSVAIVAVPSSSSATRASADGAASAAAIGAVVEDFALPDVEGKRHSLASLKGAKGTVLVFVSARCPVSNAYNERMERLAQDYKAKGVNVVGINANATEPADEVKKHAAEKGLTFPILKDADNRVADRLGAGRTPEAYVLDAANKLVYRGAIDNAQNPANVSANHLRAAIDAVLAGKAVERSEVKAFGCTIKRAGNS